MHPRLFLSIIRNLVPLTRYPYRGETSPCPVCRCEDASPVAAIDRRFKKLQTVACSGCGLFYSNPMPTDAELDRYYQHFYRFDYQWRISSPSERHRKKRRAEADRRLSAMQDLLAPGACTLDFGTGSGEFMSAMRDAGFDAHGFEPGETYGKFARELHQDRVTIANWQTVEYRQSSFDMISAFHVMEHLADPVAAMRKAAGWLKPGGLFYIEVPDMPRSFSAKGLGAFHYAHLVGFNHANLCLAAAMAGLNPVRTISNTGIVFRKEKASRHCPPIASSDATSPMRCSRQPSHMSSLPGIFFPNTGASWAFPPCRQTSPAQARSHPKPLCRPPPCLRNGISRADHEDHLRLKRGPQPGKEPFSRLAFGRFLFRSRCGPVQHSHACCCQ